MFRRFGVIRPDGSTVEILLNLRTIISIEKTPDGETLILTANGPYQSQIDYQHLADALDSARSIH